MKSVIQRVRKASKLYRTQTNLGCTTYISLIGKGSGLLFSPLRSAN